MCRSLLAILCCLFVAQRAESQEAYSVVIRGGTVVDGTGSPPVRTDIGIRGDRIVAVGDLSEATAAHLIDANGRLVTPGFFDIHSHADGDEAASSPMARRPLAENYLRQGVTTAFGGQDGGSALPLDSYLAHFEAAPTAINYGSFVGHGTVRAHVLGLENRPATDQELNQMRVLVSEAMEAGAFGLSSGLEYTPGAFASTDELIALAAATASFGGLYISHIRDEGGRLIESVDEVIQIAQEAGVAAQLTHHKIIGPQRWGGTRASLARVDSARARGLDITLDVYPYTASSTGITILFPGWAKEGGSAALKGRLADPATRARIHAAIVAHINAERGGDPSTIVAASCAWDPTRNGLSLADMARQTGREPDVSTAADIAIELIEGGGCQGVFHSMSEEDVVRVLQHPWSMVASDGGIPGMGVGVPHPRNYGSFARVLSRFVRETRVLTLEEAIRKMTSLPATRLGIEDRGVLRVGAVADIAVIDFEQARDRATFSDPHQYAEGVRDVLVSGQFVLRDGTVTGLRPGRVLRKVQR